jgi:hypothetical protein
MNRSTQRFSIHRDVIAEGGRIAKMLLPRQQLLSWRAISVVA